MGNPSFVIQSGEGVLVDVPYNPTSKPVTVTLIISPLRGRGKDRRRCEAFCNGSEAEAKITRRPLEQGAATDE